MPDNETFLKEQYAGLIDDYRIAEVIRQIGLHNSYNTDFHIAPMTATGPEFADDPISLYDEVPAARITLASLLDWLNANNAFILSIERPLGYEDNGGPCVEILFVARNADFYLPDNIEDDSILIPSRYRSTLWLIENHPEQLMYVWAGPY